MYQHSNSCGTRYWYAAMEQPLARSLQLMRFPFKKIGRETDYFGPVAPYVLDLRELEVRLEKVNPELLAYLQRPDRSDS
jgi:N-acyl amino acid synthase of PEP-CTERM/exosortase system